MSQATFPVFLFPGQSSADPGMVARARRAHSAAEEVIDHTAAVIGRDADRYLGGPITPLENNRDVQIAVFLATQMYLHALEAEGVSAAASAGLSLGEYSHLVHIGALTFADALALVSERGRCYDGAPQGVMVTVLGVDRDTVRAVVSAASPRGCLVISNYNAATQHVLAGDEAAVAWAAATLEEEYGAYTTVIEHRVPMHSPLMHEVGRSFRSALSRAVWRTPSLEYLPNVTATPMAAPAADDFMRLLVDHVREPVLWDASMDVIAARYPGATFVEVGPGGVLHNLLGRGWKQLARMRIDALADQPPLKLRRSAGALAKAEGDPRAHFAATVEALRVCV